MASVMLLVVCWCLLQASWIQAQNCPVVDSIFPPSGTVQVTFTARGSNLDGLSAIVVNIGQSETATVNGRNATHLQFVIGGTLLLNNPVVVMFTASNELCQAQLDALPPIRLELRRDIIFASLTPSVGQSGSIIVFTGSFPPRNGDNSNVTGVQIGGIPTDVLVIPTLQTFTLIVRAGPSQAAISNANITVISNYSSFLIPVATASFTYTAPGNITMVTPSQGQAGTRVIITGVNLNVSSHTLTQVLLAGNDATIVSYNDTTIVCMVMSGSSGNGSVVLRYTRVVSRVTYNGPTIVSNNSWAQLADSVINRIVPSAAAINQTIFACGDNLLGDGSQIVRVVIGSVNATQFSNTTFTIANLICINITLPLGLTGSLPINLITDTGAVIRSIVNVNIASVTSVSRESGQYGTRVNISGVELFRNLSSTTIMLAGVDASIESNDATSRTWIVVRAGRPPLLSRINITENCTTQEICTSVTNVTSNCFAVNCSARSSINATFLAESCLTTCFGENVSMCFISCSVNGTLNQTCFLQCENSTTITGNSTACFINCTMPCCVNVTTVTCENFTTCVNDSMTEMFEGSFSGQVAIVTEELGLTFNLTNSSVLWTYNISGRIETITPSFGQLGTRVVLNGTNLFGYGTSLQELLINGTMATVFSNTSTYIVFGAPNISNGSGVVDIELTSDSGAIVESIGGFVYLPAGMIVSLVPAADVISQPDDVTICEGRRAVFTCVLNSNISSNDVQWYRFIKDTGTTEMIDPNGENINFLTRTNGSTINSSLIITNAIKSYTGYFWVGTPSLNVCNASLTVTTTPSLQENAQSINVLVGQSVTLSCVPTPNDFMVNWTIQGDVIDNSEQVSLSPENLQHVLTIRNAAVSDSGEYTCYIVDFPLLINRTIRLNVLQACQQDYIGGILWNRHTINEMARIRCSTFHSSFRPGVYITRMCNSNGQWGNVDYSSCTMRLEAVPLIMVEVKDIGSSTNAISAINQVTDAVSRTNFTVLRTTHQVYEIFPSNILIIFVEINSISVPENIITRLNNLLRNLSVETSITGFQPSFQCSCTDILMRNTLNYICYGPSVAPCTFVNGSFQCTVDTYTGNGTLCGLDSDSDGFPDRQLDCTDQCCEQDECPYTFSGLTNIPTLCSSISSIGCQPENDTVWGIEWHFVTAGSVAEGKCPGLSESSGLARRVCFQNAVWDTLINVTQCQSIELMVLNNILGENQDILNSNTNNDTRDLTVLFDIREVEAVSVDVSDLTNVSTAIVPNDINTTNNIVDTLIRITEAVVEANISTETTESLQSIVESTSSTIDNLLASSNANSFEESRDMQLPVAEDLLRNTEKLAIVIGDVLDATSGNISNTSMTITQENIVFNAQLVPENTELITDIIFPEVGDTQVIIPANAIIHQRDIEGFRVPIVNYIAQNLQSYLSSQTVSEQYSNTSSGMIISSQISKAFIQLPENGTVRLKFNNTDNTGDVLTTLCVFWDFFLKDENNQTTGGWSSEGIIQDDDPNPPVLCNTKHLTSFSVLVSPKVERSFESASVLHVVSYIGCGISIFCLLLTVTAIVILRKAAFKAKHNKIHLNLSIALLLGLIVFVSGIETAKDDKIGCIVVTTLLHYFFLAVFCWALCEGIIIYVLFVEVFYQGIFQRMFFFLLLGWGLPIPIVAISLGLSYDQYGIKDNNGHRVTCWISDKDGANWAFTAPMIVILLINGVFFIASLWRIYQARKDHMSMTDAQKSKYNIAKTLIWSVLALLPLVCGTWILGLLFLADNESEILAWIFTVINSLQGFAIFFFHVVRNKEVSNEIKQRFIKWRKQQLLKSSLKDSTLERKQNNENFMLHRKDSTTEISKRVDNSDTIQKFLPSAFGPANSMSVDDSAFVSDDELAVLTKKDFLQNDELY